MADMGGSAGSETHAGDRESAGSIAELYLGNILFALERCAMALESEGKPMDAAFYRGIGRKLAGAYGAHRAESA